MGVPTVSSARALVESDEERMLILFPLRLLALWSDQTDRMHRWLVFNRAGGLPVFGARPGWCMPWRVPLDPPLPAVPWFWSGLLDLWIAAPGWTPA